MKTQPEIPDSWSEVASACAAVGPSAAVIDRAAAMPTNPPAGPVTRRLLIAWSLYQGRVNGGSFRHAHGGFGVWGNRHEPFLNRVCGYWADTQQLVLRDLAVHEPAKAKAVLARIIELADRARADIPRIHRMAMPGVGKQMNHCLLEFLAELGDVAIQVRDHEDDRFPYFTRPQDPPTINGKLGH